MTEIQQKAELFAREVPEGQFRTGEAKEPYAVHLEEVVELVKTYGGSEIEICAAWLHDTVEDCPPTNFENIEQLLGSKVDDGKIKRLGLFGAPSPHSALRTGDYPGRTGA